MEKKYDEIENRGFVGIGIFNGKSYQNLGSLLRTAQQFNCNFLFTIGNRYKRQITDTGHVGRHVPIFNFADFDELKRVCPNNTEIVGVEMCDRAIPLETHHIFPRVIYLLGAEDEGLPDKVIKTCRKVVKLPGNVSMNVSCVGSIVLYNHFLKTRKSSSPYV